VDEKAFMETAFTDILTDPGFLENKIVFMNIGGKPGYLAISLPINCTL
jgi:hypothetical protein